MKQAQGPYIEYWHAHDRKPSNGIADTYLYLYLFLSVSSLGTSSR